MNKALVDQFVESWGAMGTFWGVNNSVARVHGLLIITERPWCIDELVDYLQISKGNVSTCLKELRSWNVIRKVLIPAERREFYVSEPNPWEMLFNIMRQRKQREFDPILASVAEACQKAEENAEGIAADRLLQMKKMLETFNKLANMILASESQAKALISFVTK